MVVWADARAVRPYMHSSSSSYQPFYASIFVRFVSIYAISARRALLFSWHLCRLAWADARAVRPYMHSSSSSYQPYGNAISPISPRNLTHFVVQYGPLYTPKWLILECDY